MSRSGAGGLPAPEHADATEHSSQKRLYSRMKQNRIVSGWYSIVAPLTRTLGRHPRLAGNLVGYALATVILFVFCLTAVGLRIQQVQEGHDKVLGRMRAVQEDTRKLLDELTAGYQPSCDAENLRRINARMFLHRFARSVGMLDDQGRLYCTLGMGLLAEPKPPGADPIDGSIGRYYLKTPVPRFIGPVPGKITGTVVQRGQFQVLIDSAPTQEAYAENSDAVWAGAGAQRQRIYGGPLADWTDSPVAPDAPRVRMNWAHMRLLVTSTVPGVSPVSVQSVLGWHTVDIGRMRLLVVVAGFCFLFGLFAANELTRRCRHFESMDYRIRHLCTPANVVCHYQPILELATGRMIGCEVLARLSDGDKLLYPDKFIPALNRQHLGWSFDSAVSRAALHELAASLPPQKHFAVALNFFPHNLKRDAIHGHLHAVLGEIGRTDLQIELEVTEYDFSPELAPELRLLKADGYGISIDDFGTGYSNLGTVKKLSPDYLKIDRSFVFEMEDETIRSSLIPEIIAIAKAVGSQVIAEGIETAAQQDQLKALGVQYGQGYYFAKPMSMADLKKYIAAKA